LRGGEDAAHGQRDTAELRGSERAPGGATLRGGEDAARGQMDAPELRGSGRPPSGGTLRGGEDAAHGQMDAPELRGSGRATDGGTLHGGEDAALGQRDVPELRGAGEAASGGTLRGSEEAPRGQMDAAELRGSGGAPSGGTLRGGEDAAGARIDGSEPRGVGRSLNEAEALALFAEHGIRVVRHAVAHTPEGAATVAASFGLERLVVKVLSRAIAHKSDVGGVKLDVPVAEVEATCREIRSRLAGKPIEGWLIQERVPAGAELLLGVIRDAQLGPALVLGAGGIATEVFGDSCLRLLPLRDNDPAEMLGELRCRVLLEGFRGQPPGDLDALFEAMRRFAALGERVVEAEINPLFVLPRGQGVVAADGLVILTER
jgi:hypothetical protein